MADVSDDRLLVVPGWMTRLDMSVFRLLLRETGRRLGGGDLAELGVYQGLSACLLGAYLREKEVLTVVDLFGSKAHDGDNQTENDEQYGHLTRRRFEENYTSIHGNLPTIVEGPSSSVLAHASSGTHRFVHVDASHLYEHVRGDIEAARKLLADDGVVVFDDYRAPHTPGVAAAVWEAAGKGMRPFALTPDKMYATWGDHGLWLDVVSEWLRQSDCEGETQRIHGLELLRVKPKKPPAFVRYTPPAALPALTRVKRRVMARRRADSR